VVCGAADPPLPFAIAVSGPPGMAESTLRLSVPAEDRLSHVVPFSA
jgi:hypothetical protein